MKRTFVLSLLLSWCFVPQLAVAHHAATFMFDVSKSVTVEGTVASVSFKSPHVSYRVAITNDAGEEEIWTGVGHNPTGLVRQGWMRKTIQVGDTITMTGDSSRDGTPVLFLRSVTLADGRILGQQPGGAEARAEAP